MLAQRQPEKHLIKSADFTSFPTSRAVGRPNGAVCRRQYAACTVGVWFTGVLLGFISVAEIRYEIGPTVTFLASTLNKK